jgi:hypothetical protein
MSVSEKKVKMANMFAITATVVAIGAVVFSFQTQTIVTKSLSEPTYIWSKDGTCYYDDRSSGVAVCRTEPSIKVPSPPGFDGLCLSPYVDPKCN